MEDVEDIYELAPMQHGLLFDSVTAGDTGLYLIQLEYSLRGELRPADFELAWQKTVRRHGILRTSFHWEGLQKPLQVVHKAVELVLERHDWTGAVNSELELRAARFREADRARGMDLEQAPLMRLALIDEGAGSWRLLWSFHHILMEGWSASLVLDEVLAHYRSLASGRPAELAEHRPYHDFVAWFQEQDTAHAEAYWRGELRGLESPTHLGIDRSPSTVQTGSAYERFQLQLDAAETQLLKDFAQGHGLTLNTVVLGAWAVLLSRYTGDEDVVFGTMVSGRSASLPGINTIIGLFVNLLPARARVAPREALVPWLQSLQSRQAQQREFEHCSLGQVKSWSDVPAGLPLFESLIVFENWQGDLAASEWDAGLLVQDVVGDNREAGHHVTLVVAPGTELELAASYDKERFDAQAIERLLANLRVVLLGMAEDPNRRLGELPFLSEAERALLDQFNATAAAPTSSGWVHEQVASRAVAGPDRIAIRCGARAVSYGELDASAEALAQVLRNNGVGRGSRVAVCVERSPEMIAALLATLKTGAAYVPLDPAYPAARIGYILGDANAAVLVTEAALAEGLPAHGGTTVILEEVDWTGAVEGNAPAPVLAAEDLAYVIYTSGSTGKPKGVQVGHGALVNFLDTMRCEPGLCADDVLVAVTTLSFDIAGLELYLPLTTGAVVALATREEAGDGAQLISLLERTQATAMQATPATWRLLVQSGWSGSQRLTALCGGEALPRELADDIAPRCRALWNMYGPTETTIWSTAGRFAVGEPLTIGAPIGNTQVHALGADLERLPVGVTGEIYIGGDGLARGYSERADLTAERFIADPFHAEPGRRMYWTGDVGRWRADGRLEILGRVDHQVKLRGFRIELGEIEVALASHATARENVVVVREDQPGDKRLVAYVACPESEYPGGSRLRDFLREGLPDYMVPVLYVRLDALPRTPNGKLDRSALPAPEGARPDTAQGFLAPRNPLEEQLAAIWQTVLGVERVGVRDNFFDLGGHSLLLMPVIGELKSQFEIKLSPGDLVVASLGQVAALCQQRMLEAGLELPGGMEPAPAGAATASSAAGALPGTPAWGASAAVRGQPEPLYFGEPGQALFACYHPPLLMEGELARDRALVLCQPLGHEYIQFHRAFRQLALLLAEAGFHVLRFDFHGCGDSHGDERDWSVDRWVLDVEAAMGELAQRSGVSRIGLVGMRMGGALAALAAAGRDDVEELVLWDPVLAGRDYLAELRESHARMASYAHVRPRPTDGLEEALGFPLRTELTAEFEQLDMLALRRSTARRVLLVESNASVAQEPLRAKLETLAGDERAGAAIQLQRHANPNMWVWLEDFGKMHVPRKILEAIVNWLSEERT